MTPEPSGRLYSAVTRHWPRIATGLVVALGIVELVAGGLTADSGVEFYLMAWAGTTGGVWFLFEKAENTLSEESRERVVTWAREKDLSSSIRSIPDQFALLFDRVFGERHFSRRCFLRSVVASTLVVVIVATLFGSPLPLFRDLPWYQLPNFWAVAAIAGLVYNAVPDYVSLLESRWMISWMQRRRSLLLPLVLDFVVTALVSFAFLMIVGDWAWSPPNAEALASIPYVDVALFLDPDGMIHLDLDDFIREVTDPRFLSNEVWSPYWQLKIYFYSAFFTSAWLWLYVASVLGSRVLLRMNSGVGFLLRVTDIERQPFRSMGFVSVTIVSVVFALGLPFVLL